MKNSTYKIYRNAISKKSSDSLFKHFLNVCSFFCPDEFKKKNFIDWGDKSLTSRLIKIRKNKILFSNIYKNLQN